MKDKYAIGDNLGGDNDVNEPIPYDDGNSFAPFGIDMESLYVPMYCGGVDGNSLTSDNDNKPSFGQGIEKRTRNNFAPIEKCWIANYRNMRKLANPSPSDTTIAEEFYDISYNSDINQFYEHIKKHINNEQIRLYFQKLTQKFIQYVRNHPKRSVKSIRSHLYNTNRNQKYQE